MLWGTGNTPRKGGNWYYIIAVPPILPSKHVPSLPYGQVARPTEASLSLSGFGEGLSEGTGKFGDVLCLWKFTGTPGYDEARPQSPQHTEDSNNETNSPSIHRAPCARAPHATMSDQTGTLFHLLIPVTGAAVTGHVKVFKRCAVTSNVFDKRNLSWVGFADHNSTTMRVAPSQPGF